MNHYTMGAVCRMLNVPRHKVLYALERQFVPEPQTRVNRCRVFMEEDLAALRAYFNSKGNSTEREVSQS
jgi:hypothetical protein